MSTYKTKYPIYVISLGRWERRQTVKTLESIKADYKIVVEPKEYIKYSSVINSDKIIKAPENFSEKDKGSIPVRNFVWEHSIKNGHKKHWILDDNIESIERYNNNMKIKCKSIAPFLACEDFSDRYINVALSGMNYSNFCPSSDGRPPFRFNTRIYSCILINNKIPFRWRGKYNEDTDLSLRVLKAGYCTILFNAFLIGKRATMSQKGGNTDLLYMKTNNRYEFAKSLMDQHPDIVKITKKFGRYHHQVNYNTFKKNKPVLKLGIKIKKGVNNYGMELKKVKS
jgi:hypothetical protein